jgi:TolA-binding protein
VKHIQKRQAELEARVSELTGSVEELRTLQEENNEKIDAKIDALAKRLEQIDASYRRGWAKVDERLKKLEEMPEPKPSRTKTADDLYVLANSYFAQGKYEDAVLHFQRFINAHPDDRRIPSAYLMQGLSLLNLGRNKDAAYFLKALVDKYPNTKEAQAAEEKLREIK